MPASSVTAQLSCCWLGARTLVVLLRLPHFGAPSVGRSRSVCSRYALWMEYPLTVMPGRRGGIFVGGWAQGGLQAGLPRWENVQLMRWISNPPHPGGACHQGRLGRVQPPSTHQCRRSGGGVWLNSWCLPLLFTHTQYGKIKEIKELLGKTEMR